MKKIIALLMALTLVFAFAACGGKDDAATTATTTDLFATEEDTTPIDETTVAADATTVAGEATTAAATDATTVAGETTTAAGVTTTAATNGLNSTDIAAIVAYYNAANIKTNKEGAPKGKQTMKLTSDITGDGAIGAIAKVLSPAAEKALAKNSTETDYIPGKGQIQASDVTKATATSKNGKTTITMAFKEQTDGSDADSKAGPVGRGIGTLGSIDGALKELGAEIVSGRDTVKLTYKNAFLKCVIDENTGKIVSGTWHYEVNILVGDAQAKLGIKANLKNLKAVVAYEVVI